MSDVRGCAQPGGHRAAGFVGGVLTAVIALGILIHTNVRMTLLTFAILLGLRADSAAGLQRRSGPIFRERAKINAEVTGAADGVAGRRARGERDTTRKESEARVFAGGVKRLLDNVISSLTAQSLMTLSSTMVLGVVGGLIMYLGAHENQAGRLDGRHVCESSRCCWPS